MAPNFLNQSQPDRSACRADLPATPGSSPYSASPTLVGPVMRTFRDLLFSSEFLKLFPIIVLEKEGFAFGQFLNGG